MLIYLSRHLDQETAKVPLRYSSQAVTCYYQSNHSKVEAIQLSALPKDTIRKFAGLSSHCPFSMLNVKQGSCKYQVLKCFGLTRPGSGNQEWDSSRMNWVNLFQFLKKGQVFLYKKAYLRKKGLWKFCAGSKLLSPTPTDYKFLRLWLYTHKYNAVWIYLWHSSYEKQTHITNRV